MLSSFRHLIAIALLALLSLQAIGAAYTYAGTEAGAHSDAALSLFSEDDVAATPARLAALHVTRGEQLPPVPAPHSPPSPYVCSPVPAPLHVRASHIGEGPQRPPCSLA